MCDSATGLAARQRSTAGVMASSGEQKIMVFKLGQGFGRYDGATSALLMKRDRVNLGRAATPPSLQLRGGELCFDSQGSGHQSGAQQNCRRARLGWHTGLDLPLRSSRDAIAEVGFN